MITVTNESLLVSQRSKRVESAIRYLPRHFSPRASLVFSLDVGLAHFDFLTLYNIQPSLHCLFSFLNGFTICLVPLFVCSDAGVRTMAGTQEHIALFPLTQSRRQFVETSRYELSALSLAMHNDDDDYWIGTEKEEVTRGIGKWQFVAGSLTLVGYPKTYTSRSTTHTHSPTALRLLLLLHSALLQYPTYM